MIVLLSRDFIFATKVTGTAQQLGLPIASVMSLDALRERLTTGDVTGVILDLASGIAAADVSAMMATPRPKLLAFGSHVDTAALQSARDAGFDVVLPRSKFTAELPALLSALTV